MNDKRWISRDTLSSPGCTMSLWKQGIKETLTTAKCERNKEKNEDAKNK